MRIRRTIEAVIEPPSPIAELTMLNPQLPVNLLRFRDDWTAP